MQIEESMVKRIRTTLGLTQEQFAHLMGVTSKTISRWEHGESSRISEAQRLQFRKLAVIVASKQLTKIFRDVANNDPLQTPIVMDYIWSSAQAKSVELKDAAKKIDNFFKKGDR